MSGGIEYPEGEFRVEGDDFIALQHAIEPRNFPRTVGVGPNVTTVLGNQCFVALDMVPVLVGVNNRVERQTVIVKKCVDQFVAPGIDDNDGAIIQHNKIGEVAQLTVGVNGVDLHGNLEVN